MLGAGLIIGIGPQNTLVLRQGLRRQHLLLMVVLCTLIDACLIALGTLGVGIMLQSELLVKLMTYAGVALLLVYGARSFWAAFSPASGMQEATFLSSRRQIVLTLLAVSLLNPSVYVDTMLLIGGSATRYQAELRPWFASGAIFASLIWFFSLSYGSALLAPFLTQKRVLRFLDLLSGGILCAIAVRLLAHV